MNTCLLFVANNIYALRLFGRMARVLDKKGIKSVIATDDYRSFQDSIRLSDNVVFLGIPRDYRSTSQKDIPAQVLLDAENAYDANKSRFIRKPRIRGDYIRNSTTWIESFLDSVHPNGVVFWNGQLYYHLLIRSSVIRRGIPTVYLENGYFPGTLSIDRFGVNFSSYLLTHTTNTDCNYERIESYLNLIRENVVNKRQIPRLAKEAHVEMVINKRTVMQHVMASFQRRQLDEIVAEPNLLRKIFARYIESHYRNYTMASCSSTLPKERYVFLPLQVGDDTQITRHSPWIKTMDELVYATHEALPDGYKLIVRDHPEDRSRRSYREIITFLQSVGGYWAPTQELLPILANASAVVTVNSTVGFEALIWNRPVVTVGQAFYGRPGVAFSAGSQEELRKALSLAVSTPINNKAILQMMHQVAFEAHFKGGLGYLNDEDQILAVDRILTLLEV